MSSLRASPAKSKTVTSSRTVKPSQDRLDEGLAHIRLIRHQYQAKPLESFGSLSSSEEPTQEQEKQKLAALQTIYATRTTRADQRFNQTSKNRNALQSQLNEALKAHGITIHAASNFNTALYKIFNADASGRINRGSNDTAFSAEHPRAAKAYQSARDSTITVGLFNRWVKVHRAAKNAKDDHDRECKAAYDWLEKETIKVLAGSSLER